MTTTHSQRQEAVMTRNDYMVVGVDTRNRWMGTTGPFAVNNEGGRKDVKDVQDDIAAYAGENQDIIYMVVPKDDFYEYYRTSLWGGRV